MIAKANTLTCKPVSALALLSLRLLPVLYQWQREKGTAVADNLGYVTIQNGDPYVTVSENNTNVTNLV